MAHAEHHHRHMTLNTDGRAHPLENALVVTVAVLAAVAAICAFFPGMHVLGSWAGVAGVATGIYAQYRSATTAERWVIVIGWGVSAVGLALNLAHGGLY
ncbi:MAG TPA: hypothetical protein VLW53_19770 [Candidatus Eisenbacteria bacterium]|nr:hypothetical protein [Candidatus Eisenbacteria bacterium]